MKWTAATLMVLLLPSAAFSFNIHPSRLQLLSRYCCTHPDCSYSHGTAAPRPYANTALYYINEDTSADQKHIEEASLSKKSLHPIQKKLWDSYLANGRGAHELFDSIDLDQTGLIHRNEVIYFFDSVEREGVRPDAFKRLEQLSTDHSLDQKEFLRWLTLATRMEPQKLETIKKSYDALPDVGKRRAEAEVAAPKEDHHYSWNETTMAQSLRKMQYAVRGEVVMK